MKEYTVNVSDIGDISKRMDTLRGDWSEIAFNALRESLTATVYNDVKKRTPRSQRTSYYAGKNYQEKGIGQGNLRKDTLVRPLTKGENSRSVSIGAPNVGYSGHVHEMDDKKTRWSTPGTGSHYISEPVEKHKDEIVKQMTKSIDFMMKGRGII